MGTINFSSVGFARGFLIHDSHFPLLHSTDAVVLLPNILCLNLVSLLNYHSKYYSKAFIGIKNNTYPEFSEISLIHQSYTPTH